MPTLAQTSKKSLPDRLISGCSGVLFGEVPAGKPTRKKPSNAATSSRRTAASHPSRDSTSDSRCCQPREISARHSERSENFLSRRDSCAEKSLFAFVEAGLQPGALGFARHLPLVTVFVSNGRARPNPQAAALVLLVRRYPDTLERLENIAAS
jgi:hypothetical protein